jgi:hypothetical protein
MITRWIISCFARDSADDPAVEATPKNERAGCSSDMRMSPATISAYA